MASHNNTTATHPAFVTDLVLCMWFVVSFAFTAIASLILVFLVSVTLTVKKLRRGAGYLLLNLFIVNLLISGFAQPIMLVEKFMAARGNRPELNCTAAMFIRLVALCVECWAELSLAINRFVAILFPHHYRFWTTKTASFFLVLASWVLSIAAMFPTLYGYGIVLRKFPPFFVCGALRDPDGPFIPVLELGMYLPLGMVCIVYAVVGVNLIVRRTTRGNAAMQRSVNLAGILFASYFFNLLCYIPLPIAANHFAKALSSSPTASMWLVTAQISGYGANPILILALKDEYRKSARSLLHRSKVVASDTLRLVSVTGVRVTAVRHGPEVGGQELPPHFD